MKILKHSFFIKAYKKKDAKKFLLELDSAAHELYIKLNNINPESLNISDYSKRYLLSYTANLEKHISKYAYLVYYALNNENKEYSNMTILDYGGGIGLLSLLLKQLGIGTVIYNDIYDLSCKDAKELANSLDLEANYYIEGNIDDVIHSTNKSAITLNSIISYDVIEHIYKPYEFINRISNLNNKNCSVVIASGANPLNPIINAKLRMHQINIERENRKYVKGHKERDALKSYRSLRNIIIKEWLKKHFIIEKGQNIKKLSEITRGYIKEDIEILLKNYYFENKIICPIKDLTNTCDPITGNWDEHLMNPYNIACILKKRFYFVNIKSGLFFHEKRNLRSFIDEVSMYFNILYLAPFYLIVSKNEE